ncbi:hypothetical protein KC727_03020 [Candidatus Kaiserbacteria bacterium]|nr:hypothetical protein [Candidatus Kaiserbacteria bacterium]
MYTTHHNRTLGFSTLELLIAFAVMTLGITAVVMVAFGNQSIAIDTELAQRGLYIAETKLEEAAVATLNDFDSVSSDGTPVAYNSIFDTQTRVSDISECAKNITVEASWNRNLRSLNTSLSSVFVNPEEAAALGTECVDEEPEDDWDNPFTFESENIGGQSNATALYSENNIIYLTTNPPTADKKDFFIYEFDESGPTLTELSSSNTDSTDSLGLLDVAIGTFGGHSYAFAASENPLGQLRTFEITDPSLPIELFVSALPGVAGSFPEGRVVYYYDGRVYVGTRETAGHEFHIFDVSGLPSIPPIHIGSIELTHTVRDIAVRGDFAYLATSDNSRELMVIDISNPGSLEHPDDSGLGFNASGGDDGTAVFVTGQRVYLGRAKTSSGTSDNFYILEGDAVRDGAEITDGELGKKDIGLSNNTHTAGIVVRSDLAFLSLDDPTTGLAIYNIQDPLAIEPPASCSVYNFSENSVGLAMDGRYVFSANRSNAEIRIISDQTVACGS